MGKNNSEAEFLPRKVTSFPTPGGGSGQIIYGWGEMSWLDEKKNSSTA